MDRFTADQLDGLIGIYYAPSTEDRNSAVMVLEYLPGMKPKRYSWYWLDMESWVPEPDGHVPLIPDYKWLLPDDAVRVWPAAPTTRKDEDE